MTDKSSQSGKITELARALACDEDEERWDEQLNKVAKDKPERDKK